MSDNHFIFTRPSGSPVDKDRATVTITAHYQEWEPANSTHIRHAFDYLENPAKTPFQKIVRVDVGKPTEIPLGDNEPGKCMLVLEHQHARISGDSPAKDILQQAQESNIITLTDENGVSLGLVLPYRSCINHFPGKVFATAKTATALLHVLVIPADV